MAMTQSRWGESSDGSDSDGAMRYAVRVLAFGALLIFLNVYWIVAGEHRIIREVTVLSLVPTVLFSVFMITLVNHVIRRYSPRWALKSSEIAALYAMISVATALSGRDIVRQLVPNQIIGVWLATSENDWANLFHRFFPEWLTINDRDAISGYFSPGTETFWQPEIVGAWLHPFLAWSFFASVFLVVTLCIGILVRKQWIEHEKLNFPIAQLQIEIIGNTAGLFSSRLTWIGFGIAFAIEVVNGIHFLYPAFPHIPIKDHEFAPYFTEKPWNAIPEFPMNIHLFVVGLGYLMPIHLSFSLWFFYLFWILLHPTFSALGWRQLDRWHGEYRGGAWIAIALVAAWTSRHHLRALFRGFFGRHEEASREEPLYRFATIGAIGGIIIMLVFWRIAGMSMWVAVVYFGIYLTLTVAAMRMRAELGPPTHELHGMLPDRILVMFTGGRLPGPRNLTLTTLLQWMAYGYRSHPSPHQIEGLKVAAAIGLKDRRLIPAVIFAGTVGVVFAIGLHIVLYYSDTYRQGLDAVYPFHVLARWVAFPEGPEPRKIAGMGGGFAVAILLAVLKRRFLWWPLYPVGYAVSYGWCISRMWPGIFIGWLAKRIIFSSGGIGSYRRYLPLFVGFILGQFLAGSIWSIIGIATDRTIYTLFP